MAFTEKPPAMPDPAITPLVNLQTGKINPVWLEWMIRQKAWELRMAAAIP